jgi:hypothetical protein
MSPRLVRQDTVLSESEKPGSEGSQILPSPDLTPSLHFGAPLAVRFEENHTAGRDDLSAIVPASAAHRLNIQLFRRDDGGRLGEVGFRRHADSAGLPDDVSSEALAKEEAFGVSNDEAKSGNAKRRYAGTLYRTSCFLLSAMTVRINSAYWALRSNRSSCEPTSAIAPSLKKRLKSVSKISGS